MTARVSIDRPAIYDMLKSADIIARVRHWRTSRLLLRPYKIPTPRPPKGVEIEYDRYVESAQDPARFFRD